MTSRSADRFDALPKVELHLHLEGAIPLPALAELARKHGEKEAADLDALRERFRFRDFPHFIDTWVWKNGLLRELDDFAFVAEAVAASWLDEEGRARLIASLRAEAAWGEE